MGAAQTPSMKEIINDVSQRLITEQCEFSGKHRIRKEDQKSSQTLAR